MKLVLCLMVFILFFKSYDASSKNANATTSIRSARSTRRPTNCLRGPDLVYMRRPVRSVYLYRRNEIRNVSLRQYYLPVWNISAMPRKHFNTIVNWFFFHPYYRCDDRSQYLFCEHYCVVNATTLDRIVECIFLTDMWSLKTFHCYVCRDKYRAYECGTRQYVFFPGKK